MRNRVLAFQLVVVAFLVAYSSNGFGQAAELGRTAEEITAVKAARAFQAEYRRGGMSGLGAAIDECYTRAIKFRTDDAALYCFVLDFIASEVDAATNRMDGFPTAERSHRESWAARIDSLYAILGFDESKQREKTRRWTDLAWRGMREIISHRSRVELNLD